MFHFGERTLKAPSYLRFENTQFRNIGSGVSQIPPIESPNWEDFGSTCIGSVVARRLPCARSLLGFQRSRSLGFPRAWKD